MLGDLELAVVGCGAITESYYFPALAADAQARERVWLVDPSRQRREAAAARFGFRASQLVSGIDALPDTVRAAINATPSHLHVATTLPLIERGISVLVEKPFAETAPDAWALLDAAAGRCLLSANHYRRLCPSYRLAHDLIAAGEIGAIRRITWSEGTKFDWPTQSGFYFRRPWATGRPRGALLDIGAHVLDVICWWLDAPLLQVGSATMDGYGGPECFATAELAADGIPIEIAISFHAKLSNRYVVEGTRGALRGSTSDFATIEVQRGSGPWRAMTGPGPARWTDFAQRLIANFTAAIEGREPLLIDPASLVAPLEAIDAIYERAGSALPSYYREWAA